LQRLYQIVIHDFKKERFNNSDLILFDKYLMFDCERHRITDYFVELLHSYNDKSGNAPKSLLFARCTTLLFVYVQKRNDKINSLNITHKNMSGRFITLFEC
jgi:hypothetical protein